MRQCVCPHHSGFRIDDVTSLREKLEGILNRVARNAKAETMSPLRCHYPERSQHEKRLPPSLPSIFMDCRQSVHNFVSLFEIVDCSFARSLVV